MAEPLPRERRFRAAARHYRSGRPPYAPRLIRLVAALAGIGAMVAELALDGRLREVIESHGLIARRSGDVDA